VDDCLSTSPLLASRSIFEQTAHGLRVTTRFLSDRNVQPPFAVLDGRTLAALLSTELAADADGCAFDAHFLNVECP
jgi:hypothetical protein